MLEVFLFKVRWQQDMLMLTRWVYQNNTWALLLASHFCTSNSAISMSLHALQYSEEESKKHTMHRIHENPALSKSGNNTLLSVKWTQKTLRCTPLSLRFSEKACVWACDVLWFMLWGHSIIEQWPESFNTISRLQESHWMLRHCHLLQVIWMERGQIWFPGYHLSALFVGHHLQINTGLIKHHFISKERERGRCMDTCCNTDPVYSLILYYA